MSILEKKELHFHSGTADFNLEKQVDAIIITGDPQVTNDEDVNETFASLFLTYLKRYNCI
jgi:hypothetical protein